MSGKTDETRLPADHLWKPTTAKWFGVIFGGALGYAVVRYHLAGDVTWDHFPLLRRTRVTRRALPIPPRPPSPPG